MPTAPLGKGRGDMAKLLIDDYRIPEPGFPLCGDCPKSMQVGGGRWCLIFNELLRFESVGYRRVMACYASAEAAARERKG